MSDFEEDPFKIFGSTEAPNDDEVRGQVPELFTEERGEDGELKITIHPSPTARYSAAVMAGQFQALLDTGVFNREEAFKIVLASMSAVVVHHDHGDDDDEDQ